MGEIIIQKCAYMDISTSRTLSEGVEKIGFKKAPENNFSPTDMFGFRINVL